MKFISLIFLVLFLATCKKQNETIEIIHELDPFTSVHLNSTFNVLLVEDTSFYVEISGKAKIVNGIEIVNDNGVLRIERTSKNDWLSPKSNKIQLIIHSMPLVGVNINETCSVNTLNPITSDEFGLVMKEKASEANLDLDCNTFFFWNNAPTGGKVTLQGQCFALKMWTTAIVTIDARNVIAEYGIVENGSKGDCSIYVNTLFEYRILDEGNIHIYGNPAQTNLLEHSGNGTLIVH